MIKLFFYWLFHKSKTLQHLLNDRLKVSEKKLLTNIEYALGMNECKHLRWKWRRITLNPDSPFYIFK